MLDLEKIPVRVMRDLILADFTEEQIKQMTLRDAFEHFLIWNGIIGYTDVIIRALDGLRDAEVKYKC